MIAHLSFAGITDTLPGGVRAFIYRYQQMKVDGFYDPNGSAYNYDFSESLDLNTVAEGLPEVNDLVQELEAVEPGITKDLEFGRFEVKARADATINAYALAWGISDRVMVVGALPFVQAKVRLDGGYVNYDSLNQVQNRLLQIAAGRGDGSDEARVLAQVLGQIPSISGPELQSYLVDDLGYDPIGDWSGQGFADMDVYLQYQFHKGTVFKQAMVTGVEVPTGRVEDPNSLVDVSFGNGAYGLYLGHLFDFEPLGTGLNLYTDIRYTTYLPSTRSRRLNSTPGFSIGTETEETNYQRGGFGRVMVGADQRILPVLNAYAEYKYERQLQDTYSGSYDDYDYTILGSGTGSERHKMIFGSTFSTVGLYNEGRFPLPFKVRAQYERIFHAVNADDIEVAYLHFEFYF